MFQTQLGECPNHVLRVSCWHDVRQKYWVTVSWSRIWTPPKRAGFALTSSNQKTRGHGKRATLFLLVEFKGEPLPHNNTNNKKDKKRAESTGQLGKQPEYQGFYSGQRERDIPTWRMQLRSRAFARLFPRISRISRPTNHKGEHYGACSWIVIVQSVML